MMEADGDAASDRTGRTAATVDVPCRRSWLWGSAAVLVVVVAALLPLVFTAGYYWRGDTQIAYFGAWYHLGEALRAGRYPLLDPYAWGGGNHIVEGNVGLLSPIVMLIGIGATIASNAIVYLTVVKLVFLGVSAAGAYLLTRSYGGPPPLAFVVGVLVPLSGFTLYLDAPTWFPGTIVSGMLPLVWWAIRGCVFRNWNPLWALLTGGLLATIGYVFGTAMLAVVIAACLVDGLLARRLRAALKVLALGVLIGIPAAVVRLPFLLSASVTSKTGGGVHAGGMGTTEIGDLVTSMLPTNGTGVVPVFYTAWLLPLLVFVDWRSFGRASRDLVGLVLVWAVAVVWVFAPSHIGALRYPMRLMPYLVLCTVLLGALAFARARRRDLSGKRLLLALSFTALMGYITATQTPEHWRKQAAVTAVVLVGLTVVWLLLRRRPAATPARVAPRRAAAVAAAFVGLWTIVVTGVQHHYEPYTYAVDRGMPGDISTYKQQLPAAVGDIFMVGHVDAAVEPGTSPEPLVLIANSWYVSGLAMNNVHSNTGNRAYSQRYCMNYLGFTCKGSLDTILAKEPHTGRPRVDLLSVSSLVLLKSDVSESVAKDPPTGWHVADDGQMSVIWVRDKPVPTAGGVVWSSPGLDVSELSRDDDSVRLSVGDVPSGGGEIVLSRIAWPGYQVTNATVTDPVDGYLLTLAVSPGDANREIEIHYAPPHWKLLLGALAAGGVVGVAWAVVAALASVSRRRRVTG